MVIRRAPIGYWYWHMQPIPFGWRQIGPEAHCVMDDFGFLVLSGHQTLFNQGAI